MVRKAKKPPEQLYLVAKIDGVDVAYSASQNVGLEFRDAFDLNIKATIEKIPDKFKRHNGKSMTMSFGSQRSFDGNIVTGDPLKSHLAPIYLRGENRSLYAILPTDALLVLPQLISAGSVSHIAICFDPPHHGTGIIRDVNFISAAQSAEY
tara:strand:+ start:359 stop:811 length:453 start_codon:yes stop_codon:yes gene_type:complete